MREGVNFRAVCRERGKLVPGTLREGHNVFTNYGAQWLNYLSTWKTIAGTDTEHTGWRLSQMSLGSGTQLENQNAIRMVTPLLIGNYLPSYYWHPIGTFSFPTVSSVMVSLEYIHPWFTVPNPVVREAGLTIGRNPLQGGAAASIAASVAGVTTVTGLTGLCPIHEEQLFRTTSGAHVGSYRVVRVLSETSLEISSALWGAPETGVSWTFSVRSSLLPVVAYKTFGALLLLPEFRLEIDWQLKF